MDDAATGPSRLLDLPPEIRLMVYKTALSDQIYASQPVGSRGASTDHNTNHGFTAKKALHTMGHFHGMTGCPKHRHSGLGSPLDMCRCRKASLRGDLDIPLLRICKSMFCEVRQYLWQSRLYCVPHALTRFTMEALQRCNQADHDNDI